MSGGPSAEEARAPNAFATLFAAAQIMQATIVKAKVEAYPPDLLVRPSVEGFGVLDFFKTRQILDAAAPAKAKFKEELRARLVASTSRASR